MAWRQIKLSTLDDQYLYRGRRIREVRAQEFTMHGGNVVEFPTEFYVWEEDR